MWTSRLRSSLGQIIEYIFPRSQQRSPCRSSLRGTPGTLLEGASTKFASCGLVAGGPADLHESSFATAHGGFAARLKRTIIVHLALSFESLQREDSKRTDIAGFFKPLNHTDAFAVVLLCHVIAR